LAELLASFPDDHPAVSSYNLFFTNIATDNDAGLVETWFARHAALLSGPVQELTTLMARPLRKLQDLTPVSISSLEWHRRVLTVGRAMLQLLDIQHGLKEPLDLNGDTFEELTMEAIEYIELESDAALRAMFLATKPKELSHKKYWDRMTFGESVSNFDFDHTFPDATYRPAMYRRNGRWEIRRPPIAVDIPEKDQIPTKTRPRTDSDDDEDGRAPKRQATGRALRARGNKGPRKKTAAAVPVGKVVASGKGWRGRGQ
jgi:hypothetical protein